MCSRFVAFRFHQVQWHIFLYFTRYSALRSWLVSSAETDADTSKANRSQTDWSTTYSANTTAYITSERPRTQILRNIITPLKQTASKILRVIYLVIPADFLEFG